MTRLAYTAPPAHFAARPGRSLQVRAWWAMRAMGAFGLPGLLLSAAGPGASAADGYALRAYLTTLERAGMVQRLPRSAQRDGEAAEAPLWRVRADLRLAAPDVYRRTWLELWHSRVSRGELVAAAFMERGQEVAA